MQKSLLLRFHSSRTFSSLVFPRSSFSRTFIGQQTQFTRKFHTTPFVWNDNKTPIRINDTVDGIETDLSTLLQSSTKSSELTSSIEAFQLKKDMLASHGLELEEQDKFVVLKGSKEGRTFSIKWDPTEHLQPDSGEYDGENHQDENDAESETEDPDLSGSDLNEEDDDEYDDQQKSEITVNVHIQKSKDQNLYFHCCVDSDSQFLVYRMGTDLNNMVIVSEFSEDLQDRVYEYLDELGIGEGTGEFVTLYNTNAVNLKELETIEHVKQFFSK